MVLSKATTKHVPSDQRIDITVADVKKILDLLKDMASLYRWSHIISKVRDISGDEMDLSTLYNQLMLDNLKHHTNIYYSGNLLAATVPAMLTMQAVVLDPTNDTDHRKCFYQLVISSMIQKKIKNHAAAKSWQRLELQKEKFEWTKSDSSKVID
eukprot:1310917-Ditylum_brightwellii.AAC.1